MRVLATQLDAIERTVKMAMLGGTTFNEAVQEAVKQYGLTDPQDLADLHELATQLAAKRLGDAKDMVKNAILGKGFGVNQAVQLAVKQYGVTDQKELADLNKLATQLAAKRLDDAKDMVKKTIEIGCGVDLAVQLAAGQYGVTDKNELADLHKLAAKLDSERKAKEAAQFSSTKDPRGYYAALGVGLDASEKDIGKAFRRLAMSCHPDKGGDAEDFKKISAAKEFLSDPAKRLAYDSGRIK